jgi:hypothetical protein
MAVAHDALAPVSQPRVPHRGQERLCFSLNGLGE